MTVHADASADTLLHDPTIDLLEAAINPDPHPNKGEGLLVISGGNSLMASVGPSGSLPSVGDTYGLSEIEPENGGRITEYTVKEGESVSVIAKRFGVSANTILWANGLTNAGKIKPGDTLIILPVSGVNYTVKSGDTLSSVAKRYDADADEIASFNGVSGSLTAGMQIVIPGGELAAAAPVKTTAKSSSKPATKATTKSTSAFSSGSLTNPLPGGRVSQSTHGYNAADIAAPGGTPIYAAAGGTVLTSADGWNGGYGNYVVIKHPNGTQTLYAHMSERAVSSGSVSAGEVIGYVGSTGKSTGNHLHFEVRGGKNPFSS